MKKTLLLGATALIAVVQAQAVAAQTPAAQTPAPQSSTPAAQAETGVLVFTPDFFAAQRPNTALDMVNRIPGFSVDDGSGARGFEGAVGNILINGARPASKNDTGSNVLSRTTAAQVERIELIRGGAPGVDMQGYAVVANVILRSVSSRQSILTLNGILFDGGQDIFGGSYQFTAREGDRSWGVTLSDGMGNSDSNGEGPSVRRNAAGDVIRNEVFANDGWGGSRSVRGNYAGPLMGGRVDATARLGENDWNSWSQIDSAVSHRRTDYAETGNSGEAGVTWTRSLSPRWSLEMRAIHEFSEFDSLSIANARMNGTIDPEQRFEAVGESSESIVRAMLRNERSPSLTLEMGGEVAYNMLDVTQGFTVGGVAVPLPSASVKVEETRGEVFARGSWRVRPNLVLEGGLRLESSTISQSGDADHEESFFYAKPRILATWTPAENNQLRLRFEREVGQLDFGDFVASASLGEDNVYGGNVELEPEQRWITELTYERRFWGDGVITLGLRHDEIVGVIDRLPLPGGLSATGNIGDGTLDQISLNVLLPLDRIGFSGGRFTFRNTWNETRVVDPTTGQERDISQVRPTQATIGVRQDIASWRLQWGVAWIPRLGQATYEPDQTFTWRGTDYYEMWAEYKPTATLSLRGQLNLWDDFTTTRTVYADRITRPVAYVEQRAIDPRTFVSLRLRQTF